MPRKNNTVVNPNSKAGKRAASRLVDLPSSDEDTTQSAAGKSALTARPLRTTSALKKPRLDENANMETEPLVSSPATSSAPLEDTPLISLEVTAAAVPTAADNGTLSTSQSGSPSGAETQGQNQSLESPLQPTPSVSRHADVDPDDMDDTSDFVNLHADDATLSQASVSYADVVRPDESRSALINRLKFYLSFSYPVTFKSLRCRGPSDSRIIVVTFKSTEDITEFAALLSVTHDDLKISSGLPAPIFHEFDTRAANDEEKSRSVVVTDIPLFLKSADIRSALSKYGTIVKFSLCTPRLSKFQKASVTFTDSSVVDRWFRVWVLWCQCHCLRIHPAVLSKKQLDDRLEFTAVLRNLPSNYDAMDLCRIFSNCNGASLGIPRSSTYRPRPWAYFSFKSQECKDAAMEMQFSRCGAPDHLARSCD